jgi:DNA (cytosine-5)-methyltransferase 1
LVCYSEAFIAAGYNVYYRVLDAADFGVPQHRERMFIVGLRSGEYRFPRPTHGPDSPDAIPHHDSRTAILDAPNGRGTFSKGLNGRYGHLLEAIPPGLNYSFFTERMGHPQPLFAWRSKFSDFLYKADPTRPVRTIKAQGGQYTGPFHWENRAFTIPELKRLQTFPDDYTIAGGRAVAIHQIGNSVPPQLARVLALSILDQVFEAKIPLSIPVLEEHEELGFRSRKRDLTAYYSDLARSKGASSVIKTPSTAKSRTRYVFLTEDFRLVDRVREPHGIAVAFRPLPKTWRIVAGYRKSLHSDSKFTIRIAPRSGWQLPCESVMLDGRSLDVEVFTVAWKSLESELQRHRLKADLVQLSGYYQYEPAFVAHMEINGRVPWMWRALAEVVSGKGTRETLTAARISEAWGIDVDRLAQFAQFLRDLGMEVRNHSTNPQIPKGKWLLPYAFPSLSHQSVQLRKELGV